MPVAQILEQLLHEIEPSSKELNQFYVGYLSLNETFENMKKDWNYEYI